MKGYRNEINVCMTNKKFKNFKYSEDKRDLPFDYETDIKLNALEFYKVIKYFDKLGHAGIYFNISENKQFLILEDLNKEIGTSIPLIHFYGEIKKSGYSVEYLKEFFKEYKIKELNELIVLKFSEDSPLKIELNKDWMVLAPRLRDV